MPNHPEHGKRTGYSTQPPTGGGGVGVVINIERSGLVAGFKEAGIALTAFQKQFNRNLKTKGYSISSGVSSVGRANIGDVQIHALSAAIEDSTHEWAKIISAGGKSFFKEVIKSAPNRVKPRPGRIQTHTMLDSVRGTTRKYVNSSQSEIGWTGTYFRYFSFQEDGTQNGPMPMNAVSKTMTYVNREFNNTFGKMLQHRIRNIK